VTLRTPLALLLTAALLGAPALAQSSAEEQYRYLAGLVEKGLHDLAVREARDFLRQHPTDARAELVRYRLAGALWELGSADDAVREYATLARSAGFEYRAECLFRCGEAARARSDADGARQAFEGVLAAGQGYLVPPALLALAELDLAAKRLDESEQRAAELVRAYPKSAEAALARRTLAWCAWERGDAPETVRRVRAFLREESDPERRDELRLLLGEALLSQDPRAALETFRTLETPAQAEARARGEGFALAALEDHAGAARAFESLLERAPEGRFAPEAALQAGIEHLRAGDAPAAVTRLAAAARDGAPETLYWLAQAQAKADDPRAALASLERALRQKPPAELGARIQALRGDCLQAEGRPEEALRAWEASGSGTALYAAAVAALETDPDDAVRLAERMLAARPDGDDAQRARIVLAEAHFAAGRYPAAEEALQRARQGAGDPAERARLDSRLAWCRYLARDTAGAAQRFAALVEESPRAPEAEEALAMLVRIAAEEGRAEEARAPAERYLKRYPEGRFADQALLAVARGAAPKDARARLDQWLRRFPDSALRGGVLLELAELESQAGAYEDARNHYAEARAEAPGTAQAARAGYGLAWCAWDQEDLEGCERALREVLSEPALEDGLRQSALELGISVALARGAVGPAVASWRALCGLKGDEARRLAGARRIVAHLREEGRLDDADGLLAECQRTLKTPEVAAEGLLESAYLALDRSDPARAEAALLQARRAGASPASLAEACYHIGEARLAAGDAEHALALFEGAAAAAPADSERAVDALYKLGLVHLERGELDAARQALGSLLERQPGAELAPEARFLLGEASFRDGRFEEAARRFLEVRDGAQGELRAKALFRAGLSLARLERWRECDGLLSELAQASPDFPNRAEAELWRGRALAAQGKLRPARAAFERTLALDQGQLAAGARLGLGGLAEAEGRLDDALSEYLKVALLYAHEESVSEALYSAGRVLEAQGDTARAAERYQELCAEHASSPLVPAARERLRALRVATRQED